MLCMQQHTYTKVAVITAKLSVLIRPIIILLLSARQLMQLLRDVSLLVTIITPAVQHLPCQACVIAHFEGNFN